MTPIDAWQTWVPVAVQIVSTSGAIVIAVVAARDKITRRLDQIGADLESVKRDVERNTTRIDLLYLARGPEHEAK